MNPLVKVALVGTEKAPGPIPATGSEVDAFTPALAEGGLGRVLLLSAGSLAVYRLAGWRPRVGKPSGEKAPAEARPVCSPRATSLVKDLMASGRTDLLSTAYARIGRAGLRLPHELIAEALCTGSPEVKAVLPDAIGERGRWLVSLNADWGWAAEGVHADEGALPPEAEQIWKEGSFAGRKQILLRQRRVDPALARRWLETVFHKESADNRLAFLETLARGLSAEDEAFLERALDDRSAKVRGAAAELLALLPSSALSARMWARASGMVRCEVPPVPTGMMGRLKAMIGAGGAGKVRLIVEPVQETDKAWERDGIPSSPPAGMGKRAFWLSRVVPLIPPGAWTRQFPLTPPEVVAAAMELEWGPSFIEGLALAAIRFKAGEWAGPLWDLGHGPACPAELKAHTGALLWIMPAAELEDRALALIQAQRGDPEAAAAQVLAHLEIPWSERLSLKYLEGLRAFSRTLYLRAKGGQDGWQATLSAAALGLHPKTLTRALEPWPDEGKNHPDSWYLREWSRHFERFTETIRVREALDKEIPA